MSNEAEKEVMELYQTWTRAWQTVDPELMLSLYDLESDDLVYQSEERGIDACDVRMALGPSRIPGGLLTEPGRRPDRQSSR